MSDRVCSIWPQLRWKTGLRRHLMNFVRKRIKSIESVLQLKLENTLKLMYGVYIYRCLICFVFFLVEKCIGTKRCKYFVLCKKITPWGAVRLMNSWFHHLADTLMHIDCCNYSHETRHYLCCIIAVHRQRNRQ